MGNKFKLPSEKIQRIESLERKFGIEDMNIFAYLREEDELIVNGELYGSKLNDKIQMICSVYDLNGDIIASSDENCYYCCGSVSRVISPGCFKGIFPFSIHVDIPIGNKIDKIRVYIKKF